MIDYTDVIIIGIDDFVIVPNSWSELLVFIPSTFPNAKALSTGFSDRAQGHMLHPDWDIALWNKP